MEVPPQRRGDETSFLVSCNGSCQSIDIKVKGNRYDTGFELFAQEDDKPTIDINDAYSISCIECENFCSSLNDNSYGGEHSCENLSTSKDSFFVTVYTRYSHDELKITFKGGNILNITNIGKKLKMSFSLQIAQ